MQLIDSHAHLDSRRFDADREAAIARAQEAGLVAIVNAGADLDSSRAAIALAEKHPFVYASVGVHPHDAKTLTPQVLDELRDLGRHPKVVAVGEIGLDFYRDLSPREVQWDAFVRQLALANELKLPVIVHSRASDADREDAHRETLAVLRRWAAPGRRGVLHSYAMGPDRLPEVMALGLYVGLSGPVTYRDAAGLRAVAAQVPLERLLVETDCPYLTPEPRRGQRNEPAYVEWVVRQVADARRSTPQAIAEATTRNAMELFGIGQAGT